MTEMQIVARYSESFPVAVDRLIRELGIFYFEVPMPAGNSGRIDNNGGHFSITVNASEGPQRRRFTAAHELGHYLLHRDLIPPGGHADRLFNAAGYEDTHSAITPVHEAQANQFAANLLMPAGYLRANYDKSRDNFSELARLCAVSGKAMRIRLKALGLRTSAS